MLPGLGLSALPDVLPAGETLTRLFLGSNQLTRIPESVFLLPRLSHLDLRDNPLEAAPDTLAQQLPENLKVLLYRGAEPPPMEWIERFNPADLKVLRDRVEYPVTREWLESLAATPPQASRSRDFHLIFQARRPLD